MLAILFYFTLGQNVKNKIKNTSGDMAAHMAEIGEWGKKETMTGKTHIAKSNVAFLKFQFSNRPEDKTNFFVTF